MYARLTIIRTALIALIAAVAITVISITMREEWNIGANPAKQTRPSGWTALGISAMLLPLLLAAVIGGLWWYNRPGAARVQNRLARTAGAFAVIVGFVVATGLVVSNNPLEGANKGIFWRGLLSGLIAGVALLLVEWVMIGLVRLIAQDTQNRADLEYAVDHHRQLLEDNGIDWRATF